MDETRDDIVIKIRGLRKRLGGRDVLNGVDLDVRRGETLSIIGVSGCGKTTLLRHIIGLVRPDSGSILVEGKELTAAKDRRLEEIRRLFGMVFQSAALLNSMTVKENVALPLRELDKHLKEAEISKIVAEKLALVRMTGTEDLMPAELSGGMRKRVGLARAIVRNPRVILYDEPTTGLDPVICATIHRMITDMQKKLGVTSIVITHDMHGAMQTSDHIAMLHDGAIVAYGTPDEIGASVHPAVRQLLDGRIEGPLLDDPIVQEDAADVG